MTTDKHKNGILGTLLAAFATRSIINTTNRFIYPFAPVISRGLGVPLTAVTSVIALNQATALIGIFTSSIGDHTGYKRMMLAGLVILIFGMVLVGFLPLYLSFVVAMFLCGLGKNFFDPAIQAYVGTRVSYKRRGLVVGILEISWAAATLAGIPLAGWIISKMGWQAPFLVLAASGLICLWLVAVYIEDDSRMEAVSGGMKFSIKLNRLMTSMAPLFKNPRALGAMGFAFFVSFANDNLFVIYGAWLENLFDFSVVDLGLGTAVIGVGELCGSMGTALLADRFGLKRSVCCGLLLSGLSYLFIPVSEFSMWAALGALFLIFFSFEFTIVSFISMCTELIPGARATMMSLFFGAAGLGRVAGAFFGGIVWHAMGINVVCYSSFIFSLAGLACLFWGTKKWHPQQQSLDHGKK
ncbi:Predicted arabinose efflux permease, MFS family [Desulfocicer vacuolatum DSM 3385]|uniref:Predicted arabinose efflux permease, MFS family n=1 Tax=Desulfocicer vacuolatum DSM 3385 TaxID=1121400 RepID=A0A1W2CBR5_9BACT|nr:MFS transporter [Desulfocicer vacuolatum]SMC82098.1 Predicted arabinose efflux permease, MFS family [Desulfocicer vacuolatum DSM 3385]